MNFNVSFEENDRSFDVNFQNGNNSFNMNFDNAVFVGNDDAVKSVNGILPDENGNVELDISGNVKSVNGYTEDVVLTAEDVGALPEDTVIPTKTSDLANDCYYMTYDQTDNMVLGVLEAYTDNMIKPAGKQIEENFKLVTAEIERLDSEIKDIDIPTMSADQKGGAKVGNGLVIENDVLSIDPDVLGGSGGNVTQPDWNQNDPDEADYINNRTHYDSRQTLYKFNNDTTDQEVIEGFLVYTSEEVPNIEDLIGLNFTGVFNGNIIDGVITQDSVLDMNGDGSVYLINEMMFIAYNENATFNGIPLKCGIYTINPDIIGGIYEVSINNGELKKLDYKYIPDEVTGKLKTITNITTKNNSNILNIYIPNGYTKEKNKYYVYIDSNNRLYADKPGNISTVTKINGIYVIPYLSIGDKNTREVNENAFEDNPNLVYSLNVCYKEIYTGVVLARAENHCTASGLFVSQDNEIYSVIYEHNLNETGTITFTRII